mgnify:CR=1 FL=1
MLFRSTEGKEVGMSTHAFATERTKIGKQEFEYEGHTIKDFAENPFRNFRVQGDAQFIEDAQNAKLGPSFNDFKECVEGASIFAIITARGHNPETLKEACKSYIQTGFGGIDTKKVLESIKKYNELFNLQPNDSEDELVDSYLMLCKFHPVSFNQDAAASPEKLKVEAMNDFIEYANKQAKRVRKHAVKGAKMKIGFSDDDKKNIEAMIANFKRKRKLKFKFTGPH